MGSQSVDSWEIAICSTEKSIWLIPYASQSVFGKVLVGKVYHAYWSSQDLLRAVFARGHLAKVPNLGETNKCSIHFHRFLSISHL